jgi:hypothetical protein
VHFLRFDHGTWIAVKLQFGLRLERKQATGATSDMNSCCAMRAPLNRAGRRWRLSGFGLAAGLVTLAASYGTARASEPGPFACRNACAPLAPTQLESYRAQGLSAPPGSETKLGVILWDEYRRVRPPSDGSEAVAGRVSYSPSVAGR